MQHISVSLRDYVFDALKESAAVDHRFFKDQASFLIRFELEKRGLFTYGEINPFSHYEFRIQGSKINNDKTMKEKRFSLSFDEIEMESIRIYNKGFKTGVSLDVTIPFIIEKALSRLGYTNYADHLQPADNPLITEHITSPKTITDDVLLKANEVAKRLNVSRATAYLLMNTEIPVLRFGGGNIRVRESDLEEYMNKHRDDHSNK